LPCINGEFSTQILLVACCVPRLFVIVSDVTKFAPQYIQYSLYGSHN